MYYLLFKRAIDFILASIAFIIIFPIFLLTAVCLWVSNRGKPFFLQERPGKNSRVFKVIKFKTMHDGKDKTGELLPDHQRLTPIGKLVRKTSLDEIPQLLNVIKGDMSLVGPRPLLVEYLPLYDKQQKRRHEVRPGITGWAQINGRNTLSWEDKFIYDIWYVDNISFLLDIKIIFLTILKVLKSEGVTGNGHATMSKFEGSKNK